MLNFEEQKRTQNMKRLQRRIDENLDWLRRVRNLAALSRLEREAGSNPDRKEKTQ